MVKAKGVHPIPSRTRKLSPSASMVLRGRPRGRVDRRQPIFIKEKPRHDLISCRGFSRFLPVAQTLFAHHIKACHMINTSVGALFLLGTVFALAKHGGHIHTVRSKVSKITEI